VHAATINLLHPFGLPLLRHGLEVCSFNPLQAWEPIRYDLRTCLYFIRSGSLRRARASRFHYWGGALPEFELAGGAFGLVEPGLLGDDVPGVLPFGPVEPLPELGEVFGLWPEPFAGELGGGVLAPGTGELGGGFVAPGGGAFGDAVPGAGEAVPGVGDAVPGVGVAVPGAGDAVPGAAWFGEPDDGLLPPCGAADPELPCPEPCPALEPALPEPEPELCDNAHVAPNNNTQKMVALAFIFPPLQCLCPKLQL
jgi:hypothetical protein